MFILLCGYLFIYIERPWEVWSIFGSIPIERIYMLFVLSCFLFWPGKHWAKNIQHIWVLGFFAMHYLLAPFAYSPEAAFAQGFEYFKLVVFFLLIVSCLRNEMELRNFVLAFILVMGLYMAHSLREFIAGRHFYRMGIVRMIGVDQAHGDPNTFAASIVLSLPFVLAVWRADKRRYVRLACFAFGLLALVCIVLTGSRSGFVCVSLFAVMAFWRFANRKKLFYLAMAVLLIPITFFLMPEEKQNRIRTLWDSEAGPENAQESAEGRIAGFECGMRMFLAKPLTGVGAGRDNFIGYRVAQDDGTPSQAHNLVGELLGEFGLLGSLFFLAQVLTTLWCCRTVIQSSRFFSIDDQGFLLHLATAINQGIVLLLVSGLAGHNLYRVHWLWFAAWAVLALEFSKRRAYAMWSQSESSSSHNYSAGSAHGTLYSRNPTMNPTTRSLQENPE